MVTVHEEILFAPITELRWSSDPVSEILKDDMRLNASTYTTEGRLARKAVSEYAGEKKSIGSMTSSSWVPPPIKRVFTANSDIGTPYVAPTTLLANLIKPGKFILASKMKDIQTWFVKENCLIVTQSGLVGIPIIATKSMERYIISQNAIRILFKDFKDAHYVYIFLKTKIGQSLVRTNFYGSVVTHIEPEHLEKIQIPCPPLKFKDALSEKVQKSINLRESANSLMREAEEKLYFYLKLVPIKSLKPKYFKIDELRNFEVRFSKAGLRFEASYHSPLIDEIIKELEKSGAEITTIGDKKVSKEIILPGRFKRIYVEKEYGVPFLGGKDITQFDPPELDYLSLKGHGARIAKELTLDQNMILITCSGTLGNTLLVPNHLKGWTASQHIIRVIPNEQFNPGYIYAFLSSEYGYQLIKRNRYGSVVDELNDDQVANIPLPLLSTEKMTEIGNLVLKANDLRSEAWHLEKEAIQEVEDLIRTNQK